jgi:hypothetical protein
LAYKRSVNLSQAKRRYHLKLQIVLYPGKPSVTITPSITELGIEAVSKMLIEKWDEHHAIISALPDDPIKSLHGVIKGGKSMPFCRAKTSANIKVQKSQ